MKSIRQSTAARTRLLPLPDAFVTATIATAARATYRNRVTPGDARRAADKAVRVLAVLAAFATVSACGGQVSEDRTSESPEARYARDACECATDPGCDPTAIVAGFAAGTPDEACVTAYADAMETRVTCTDTPAMPTCALFKTSPAAERYARAVCACGGNRPGCYGNALSEVRSSDPACLAQRAAGYEMDCTGRTGQECAL